MVKQDELPQLIYMIKSVIGQSRGIAFPLATLSIEIENIEDAGNYDKIEGRWAHFLRSGKFSILINKDDKSIKGLSIVETRSST